MIAFKTDVLIREAKSFDVATKEIGIASGVISLVFSVRGAIAFDDA